MAYQIKSIRYQSTPRKILLQNKNGPCPLLAAANALLLRGVITLSSECVRNGVASTDDVVNLLADRALLRSQRQNQTSLMSNSNDNDGSSNNDHHGEYHLNEVLSTLPTLQNGMDVNPQFYSCTAIEYTHNLSTLDLLGVELVHGWVLDPQDGDSTAVIGKKSYNELIEMVIGIEAWREEVERLEGLIAEVMKDELKNVGTDANGDCSNDDTGDAQTISTTDEQDSPNADQIQQQSQEEPTTLQQQQQKQHQKLTELQHKLEQASLQISRATIAQTFLSTTSHQLTHHGLTQLHTHITENSLQIFFRNNHFGTITKHNGILYLLVTDLGYANAPEIIWEKLDSIDGDTEYVNEYFERPAPREELLPLVSSSGPSTVDPEVLLAQRSQAERDYQLALAMSRGETISSAATAASSERNRDEEGKLIQAAKELSLRTYNGDTNATIAITPIPTTTISTTTALQTPSTSQLESDHQMALAYQRHEQQLEHESEQLARQLEALDRQEVQLQRQRRQRQQQGGGTRNGVNRRRQQVVNGGREVENKSSGCVIS